jgi:hypothetical protein
MKNIILTIVLFFCASIILTAQEKIIQDSTENKKNRIQHTLYFELFGNTAGLYSINYDCLFRLSDKHKIALATGFEYFFPFDRNFLSVSMQLNYLYGKKYDHLEIGTGVTIPNVYYPYDDEEKFRSFYRIYMIPLRIGYRSQSKDGGFFWKIEGIAFFPNRDYFLLLLPFSPWVGIAIGHTFKNKKH